jgi:hypothetical protein
MREKAYIWLVTGISLFVLASVTGAQEEQWLQYHSSREAPPIVGDIWPSMPKVTPEKPQGVELPDFKCNEPFFARWPTAMVPSGGLWMALDRKSKNGPYDLLYIDSNGNGSLADESAHEPYQQDERRATFGPVKVLFEGEDGPITYHLHVEFYTYSDRKYLYIRAAGWYEGTITVAGVKKHCVLIDYNTNGTFNDKSLRYHECDGIRIGKKDSRDTRYVGNLIEVDGVLYRPQIAQDGAYIKLTKAEDVRFGDIRVPETISEFAASGENGLFIRTPGNGIAELPVGKYCVDHWGIERKDEKGSTWKLEGRWSRKKVDFDVTQNRKAELSIGEPIVCTLEASKRDSTYSFSQSLKGQLGERIVLTRNGSRPRAPKLHIKSKDGSYDRSFSFEYG